MNNTSEQILSTEYSEKFDQLRKNRVAVSFYKYGPAKINFGEKLVDAMGCVDKCLKKYKETSNTEYMVDAANYCMFEFMYPQHENGHFQTTDSKDSAGIAGISINEIKRFEEEG